MVPPIWGLNRLHMREKKIHIHSHKPQSAKSSTWHPIEQLSMQFEWHMDGRINLFILQSIVMTKQQMALLIG